MSLRPTKGTSSALPIRQMVRTAVFSALLCVIGPLSLPVGPVPISLATLLIYVSCYVLGGKWGFIACAVYILLGFFGLPVFSGFSGGPAKLFGPTGGYIIGYLFLALLAGTVIEHFPHKYFWHALGLLGSTALLYAFGTVWFVFLMRCSLSYALLVCVVPFLLGDGLKIVCAMILGPQIRRALTASGVLSPSPGTKGFRGKK